MSHICPHRLHSYAQYRPFYWRRKQNNGTRDKSTDVPSKQFSYLYSYFKPILCSRNLLVTETTIDHVVLIYSSMHAICCYRSLIQDHHPISHFDAGISMRNNERCTTFRCNRSDKICLFNVFSINESAIIPRT